MKIAVGSDHAGYDLKEKVKVILLEMNHLVVDYGTDSKESCDYPDFGAKVARAVARGRVDRGVLICWTGNGMMMVANKVKGSRAGLAINRDMAYYTRLHNDANVLVLPQKYLPDTALEEVISTFLETEFEGGRHQRRLEKISEIENEVEAAER